MNRWSCSALLVALCATAVSSAAHAEDGHFYLFVAKDKPPSQELVESAWREGQKLSSCVSADGSKRRIGSAYPRLFGTSRAGDKAAIEGDFKTAKAAYFATDFDLAEMHFARAFDSVYGSPEVVAGSSTLAPRLADSAALRYTNALARKQTEAAAREQLQAFVTRFPTLSPTQTEHAPDVLAAYEQAKQVVVAGAGTLAVNVLPLELDKGGTCRVFLNGIEIGSVPQQGVASVPKGEHFVWVRCGTETSWVQRLTMKDGAIALTIPVRAMMATRADATSGGLVMTSPAEGDSSALVTAVAKSGRFVGAFIVRPQPPSKVDFGRWGEGDEAPTTFMRGNMSDKAITDLTTVREGPPATGNDSLSPWPFVVAGAGVAALIGGGIANMSYLDDRDAGVQDLDATPSLVIYGVGGALLITGVIMFVLDVTDDGDGTASVAPGGPGSLVVKF